MIVKIASTWGLLRLKLHQIQWTYSYFKWYTVYFAELNRFTQNYWNFLSKKTLTVLFYKSIIYHGTTILKGMKYLLTK